MEWYQAVSAFFTNGIRIFLCMWFIAKLSGFPALKKKLTAFSVIGAGIVTLISFWGLSQFYLIGTELIFLAVATHLLFQDKPRICFFLSFFFEVATALWDFLISAGLGVSFHSKDFLETTSPEGMASVWIVRLMMVGAALFFEKKNRLEHQEVFRLASMFAIVGLFGVVALTNQSVIPLEDDQLTTWIILSVILLFAIMIFNLNRQYEMEKEISRLKEEQAELLQRDYQTLNKTYTANAKLYHDLHNHLEVMYRYLVRGKTKEAIQYLEDLQAPIQEISQTVWTGDEAIDYLINSKISLAEQKQVTTKVNIEFPRNTNIHSADLTAVLGNLLDNALEAALQSKGELRFVWLTIRRINHMLVIKIQNGCEVPPVGNDEGLQSTKKDKLLHGWGLKSARTAAMRYDGTIETSFENNRFCAVVTLSFEAVEV